MNPEYDCPATATEREKTAHDVVVTFLRNKRLLHGGGIKKVFWTAQEWRARGEQFGNTAVLVIVHDGGQHAGAFNWSYEQYDLIDVLRQRLAEKGFWVDQCTGWYSAIYEL